MAKLKTIKAEFGITLPLGQGGGWIKATSGIEIEIEPGDEAIIEQIRQDSWLRVTEEVQKQLEKSGIKP